MSVGEYQRLMQFGSLPRDQGKKSSPSLVASYDTPGKGWPASIFFIPLFAGLTKIMKVNVAFYYIARKQQVFFEFTIFTTFGVFFM